MFGFLGCSRKRQHRFCQENLSAFLDGELSPGDCERVREHLARCEVCRWDLETLERTVGLLRSLPQVRAPRSFCIPHAVPAPVLPLWMRPWVYGTVRLATGVATLLLVITLAGNALTLPAHLAVPGAQPAPAALTAPEQWKAESVPTGGAPAEATAVAMAPALTQAPLAAAAPSALPQRSGPGEETPAAVSPAPELARGHAEPLAGAQTLTPEEAVRATAAPKGMGVGPAPNQSAVPTEPSALGGGAAGEGVTPTLQPDRSAHIMALPSGTPGVAGEALPSLAASQSLSLTVTPEFGGEGTPTATPRHALALVLTPTGGYGGTPGPTPEVNVASGTMEPTPEGTLPPTMVAMPTQPPGPTPTPTVAEFMPTPTPTPEEVAMAKAQEPPPQPTLASEPTREAGTMAKAGSRQPPSGAVAPAQDTGQPAPTGGPQPARLARVREQLAIYPWQQWTVAAAGLLTVLVAATLWLRAARARWP